MSVVNRTIFLEFVAFRTKPFHQQLFLVECFHPRVFRSCDQLPLYQLLVNSAPGESGLHLIFSVCAVSFNHFCQKDNQPCVAEKRKNNKHKYTHNGIYIYEMSAEVHPQGRSGRQGRQDLSSSSCTTQGCKGSIYYIK